MSKDLVSLLLWGVFFIAIGLWIRWKDSKKLELMEAKLSKKEEDLYALYLALEEIMDELISMGKAEQKQEMDKALSKAREENIKGQNLSAIIGESHPRDSISQGKELTPTDKKEPQGKVSHKHQEAVCLKEQGYSIEEIAKKLNMGIGEVKLILKFYQR